MTVTLPMLESHPGIAEIDRVVLADTIDELVACAEACTACADACLSEPDVAELTECIRTDLDCADICATTARVLSRHAAGEIEVPQALLEACIVACRVCGDECARHAEMHEHCRICTEACRSCEEACGRLLNTLG
jgi:uncharacterized membrane protein